MQSFACESEPIVLVTRAVIWFATTFELDLEILFLFLEATLIDFPEFLRVGLRFGTLLLEEFSELLRMVVLPFDGVFECFFKAGIIFFSYLSCFRRFRCSWAQAWKQKCLSFADLAETVIIHAIYLRTAPRRYIKCILLSDRAQAMMI